MRASDGASDKFYTRPDVAAHVVGLIPDLSDYACVVEPSAGSGSFLRALPDHTIAYDIEPEAHGILTADWLKVQRRGDGGILVGNPPFGKRSSLAKAFIKHGISLGFDTIAFILPDTFRKFSTQKIFPAEWRLVVESGLPHDVFQHVKGDVGIPCVFQVWTKRTGQTNLRVSPPPQPDCYAYLPREDPRADVCLNGNSGRVRPPHLITNPKAEHYIRILKGGARTIEDLGRLELDFRSSVSGGVAWVSKIEINAAWWSLQKSKASRSGSL